MKNILMIAVFIISLIFMFLDWLEQRHMMDKDNYTEDEKMWAEIENERHIKKMEEERKKKK